MSNALDVLLISSATKDIQVVSSICKRFSYSFDNLSDPDKILESKLEPELLIMSESGFGAEVKADEIIQISRQMFPHALLILVVNKQLNKDTMKFYEKLGAKIFMLQTEMERAKLCFAINQTLKAEYIPLKTMDLVPEREIPFGIYHLLPQKRKFLKLIHAGDKIPQDRLTRLQHNPEFYIHRSELFLFKKYIDETAERSAKGLAKRCRANFTTLQTEFTNLAFQLSDESNRSTLAEGQELMAQCRKLCEDLLANLAEFPKAWEIINSSSIGECGSLERSPTVAAYTGLFSLLSDMQNITDAMLISMLVDVGLLTISDRIAEKLRLEQSLNAEELTDLHSIPAKSLNMVLNRKLSIDERSRTVLLNVYEQVDGKGYPAQPIPEKIPLPSQMILFAKLFDTTTMVKMGIARKDPVETLVQLTNDPEITKRFSAELIRNIKEKVIPTFKPS